MQPRFLTLTDVAEQLQVSISAVRNLVKSGELKAIQLGGRGLWRVEVSALEEFIDEQYRQTSRRLDGGETPF